MGGCRDTEFYEFHNDLQLSLARMTMHGRFMVEAAEITLPNPIPELRRTQHAAPPDAFAIADIPCRFPRTHAGMTSKMFL